MPQNIVKTPRIFHKGFSEGQTGAKGQFAHMTEQTHLRSVNFIPNRDTTLRSRSRAIDLGISLLDTDKVLFYELGGQHYACVYDPLWMVRFTSDTTRAKIDIGRDVNYEDDLTLSHDDYADTIAGGSRIATEYCNSIITMLALLDKPRALNNRDNTAYLSTRLGLDRYSCSIWWSRFFIYRASPNNEGPFLNSIERPLGITENSGEFFVDQTSDLMNPIRQYADGFVSKNSLAALAPVFGGNDPTLNPASVSEAFQRIYNDLPELRKSLYRTSFGEYAVTKISGRRVILTDRREDLPPVVIDHNISKVYDLRLDYVRDIAQNHLRRIQTLTRIPFFRSIPSWEEVN